MIKKALYQGKLDKNTKKAVVQALRKTIVDDIVIYSDKKNLVNIYVDDIEYYSGIKIKEGRSIKFEDEGIVLEPGSILVISTFEDIKVKIDGQEVPEKLNNKDEVEFSLSDFATKEDVAKKATINDETEADFSVWSSKKVKEELDKKDSTISGIASSIVSNTSLDDNKETKSYSADYIEKTFIPVTTLTAYPTKESLYYPDNGGNEKVAGKWFGKDLYMKAFEGTTPEDNQSAELLPKADNLKLIKQICVIEAADGVREVNMVVQANKGEAINIKTPSSVTEVTAKPYQAVVFYTKD